MGLQACILEDRLPLDLQLLDANSHLFFVGTRKSPPFSLPLSYLRTFALSHLSVLSSRSLSSSLFFTLPDKQ